MATTLYSNTLNSLDNAWDGFTMVVQIPASVLTLPSYAIARIRFRLQAANSEPGTFSKVYVGHRAGSGDAYDFSTTPVAVLFSGSASGTASAGSTITSDWVTFSYDKTSDLLLAFYFGGGASSDGTRAQSSVTGVNTYYRAGDEAATVNKTSGYSLQANSLNAVNLIEIDSALSAGQGAFTLSGQSVGLLYGRAIAGTYGSFSLTGQNISMVFGRILTAAYGAFVLTGQSITLAIIRFFSSIFTLSQDSSMKVQGMDNSLTVVSTDTSKKVRE